MLKYLIDSLDGLEEPIKALYKDAGDGNFVLEADGLPDVDGLKKNRDDILRENKKLAEKIKAAEDKAAEETRRAEKELEEKLKKAGDVEGLNKSWEKKLADALAEKEAENRGHWQMIEDLTANNDATKLAAEIALPGSAKVLLPHIRSRLKTEVVGGKPVTVVVDESGSQTAYTLADLKKQFLEDPAFAPLVTGSKASGAGLPTNSSSGAVTSGQAKGKPDGSKEEQAAYWQAKIDELNN